MEEVLDRKDQPKRSDIFSKLSFIVAISTIATISYVVNITQKHETQSQVLDALPLDILELVLGSLLLLGFIFTTFSFIKKEPSTWIKWVAAIINILFILTISIGIVFSIG